MASYKSRAKRKIRRKMRKYPIIIAIIVVICVVSGILVYNYGDELGINIFNKQDVPAPSDGEVYFHYIDVGQGDAILITAESGNMLIDTSEPAANDALDAYLKAAKVDKFKYVVFTHTDNDHIGNAKYVVENYDIETIIMPDYSATTKVYENLLLSIEKKGIDLVLIGEDVDACEQSGYTFYLGSILNTVLAPVKDINDPNEMSVVIKCEYGETSFIFTGDAEKRSEEYMLQKWRKADLKCDVLKVGHHGSSGSSTKEFLEAVNPSIAVISCGKGNKYGHPHDEALQRLEAVNAKVYRTDLLGTVVIKTDGKIVTVIE